MKAFSAHAVLSQTSSAAYPSESKVSLSAVGYIRDSRLYAVIGADCRLVFRIYSAVQKSRVNLK